MDYVIVHDGDYDTQLQVRGRVNSDLKKLYLPYLPDAVPTVPPEFLHRKLFVPDKAELVSFMNRRNRYNRLFRWTTIHSMLIDCDYTITEKRENNRHYVVIDPPEG